MTCKDCIHNDVCRGVYLAIQDNTKLTLKEFQILCEKEDFDNQDIALYDCLFFQDRSRFVELKHAEWEEHEDMYGDPVYCCSNCREEYFLEEWTPFENCYFYCPNCGAKMSKRGEENA